MTPTINYSEQWDRISKDARANICCRMYWLPKSIIDAKWEDIQTVEQDAIKYALDVEMEDVE